MVTMTTVRCGSNGIGEDAHEHLAPMVMMWVMLFAGLVMVMIMRMLRAIRVNAVMLMAMLVMLRLMVGTTVAMGGE